jgi:hypothetical protein
VKVRRWSDMKSLIWRPVRRETSVERGFDRIRSYLSANPSTVLGDLPVSLHVLHAGLDLSRNARVERGDLEIGSHVVRIPLAWSDSRRPGLFPVLEATLEVTPQIVARPSATRLDFAGHYRLPFGPFGAVVAALGGRRLLLESVDRFLAGLVQRLELELPPEPALYASPLSRPQQECTDDRRR